MKAYPVQKVYRLMEPSPTVLVTTVHRDKPNIMTMGFHMMIQQKSPPLPSESLARKQDSEAELSWLTFALTGALVLLIAVLTVAWQAAKAALTDPVQSLRVE